VIAARLGARGFPCFSTAEFSGIPPTPRIFPNGWTPKEDPLLGKQTDEEVSARIGRPALAVGLRRFIRFKA
jgi:hypothetical protein